MTNVHEPASVVAARQLALEAQEARRGQSTRGRSVARRLASARALRDAVHGARELTGASAGS